MFGKVLHSFVCVIHDPSGGGNNKDGTISLLFAPHLSFLLTVTVAAFATRGRSQLHLGVGGVWHPPKKTRHQVCVVVRKRSVGMMSKSCMLRNTELVMLLQYYYTTEVLVTLLI